MKAAVFHGPKDVRVEDVPEPAVRPGTVKIAVDWCGICGSDLHEYLAGPIVIPHPSQPHPLTGESAPMILGHEFAGHLVDAGDGVTGVAPGDAVCVEPLLRCNQCEVCRQGRYNLCASFGVQGLSGHGGLAEYAVVPDWMVHRLPDGVDTEVGALVEPLTVGFHAVRRSGLRPGATVLVLGAGPIGLVTLLCARAAGARQAVVVEPSTARRERAARLGADAVLHPGEDDIGALGRELTGGRGFDVVFETAGVRASVAAGIALARRGGTLVEVALWEHPCEVDLNALVHAELRLVGTVAYAGDHPAVLALVADGRLRPAPLVTSRIALDEVVTRGFEALASSRDREVKILVRP